MIQYKNTKTAENLAKAFSGEAKARSKYTFYAAIARREGLDDIAEAFEQTAENEMIHARIWYNELGGIGRTVANLKDAIDGEHAEATRMYVEFAEQARQDGFPTTASLFERIAAIEARHETRYRALLEKLEAARAAAAAPATQAPPPVKRFRECRFCGHIESALPGARCEVCQSENAF